MLRLSNPTLAPLFTDEQLAAMEAARAKRELERDIDRCLARRKAARPARQEAARIGAQTRKGRAQA